MGLCPKPPNPRRWAEGMAKTHALIKRVFLRAVKGSLRLQNRLNLRFTEKSRCELGAKAEKRNFGDFEALDRLKISALLERSRKRFFSYFGFLLVFRFHQKWNIARLRVSPNAKKKCPL